METKCVFDLNFNNNTQNFYPQKPFSANCPCLCYAKLYTGWFVALNKESKMYFLDHSYLILVENLSASCCRP